MIYAYDIKCHKILNLVIFNGENDSFPKINILKVGDIIMLEDIVDESWYKGRSIRTGAVGIFPMNHVEVRIPLTSGLFTNTQPKMQFVYSNRSNNFTNTTRTHSHPSFRKKPVPLPKIINQSAPVSKMYIEFFTLLFRKLYKLL